MDIDNRNKLNNIMDFIIERERQDNVALGR